MADYTLSAKGTYDGSNFNSGVSKSSSALDSFMGKAQSVAAKVEKVATAAVGAIGSIGGAIGSMAATGGMARALNVEQAQTMFKGLNLEWKDFEGTIKGCVDGTAFAMDQAALVAANLAASGVAAGDDMNRALRGAVGTAATFGSELGDIGGIYSKVAAQGKVTGETLQQFADRGINVTSVLSQALGKSSEEIRDMVSKGKIDFATFSDAMESAFGDSAQAANQTFTGSMANMKSALNKIGEKFADPIRANAIPVFNAVRLAINAVSARLDPLVAKFSELATTISGKVIDKFNTFTEAMNSGASIMDVLKTTFGETGSKIAAVVGAIAGLGAALGALSTIGAVVPGLSGVIGMLTGGAGAAGLFSGALGILKGAFGGVSEAFGSFGAAISKAGGGLGGFKTAFVGLLTPANLVMVAVAALAAAFVYLMATNAEFRDTILESAASIGESLMPVLMQLKDTLLPAVANLISAFVPLCAKIITAVADVAAALAPVIATIATSVIPIVSQILNVIADVVTQVTWLLTPVILNIVRLIEENMPLIQAVIEGTMNAISAIISAVWPFIQTVISNALAVIQGIVNVAMAVLNGDWSGAWQAIKDLVQTVFSAIGNIIGSAVGTIIGLVVGLVTNIAQYFSDLWSSVTSKVTEIWDNVKSSFSSGVQSAISSVGELPGRIMSLFANAGTWLIDSGRSVIEGFVSGIQGAIDWAAGCVGDAIGAIRNLFPFSPAKEGPFSGKGWVLYSGISIMEALGEGAQSQEPQVIRRFRSIASSLHDALDIEPSYSSGNKSYAFETSAFDGSFTVAYPSAPNINRDAEYGKLDQLCDEVKALHKDLPVILDEHGQSDTELSRRTLSRFLED